MQNTQQATTSMQVVTKPPLSHPGIAWCKEHLSCVVFDVTLQQLLDQLLEIATRTSFFFSRKALSSSSYCMTAAKHTRA